MTAKRSSACARVTQPRSQATIMAMAPNPEPPMATGVVDVIGTPVADDRAPEPLTG